jgi:hypothetical protein
MGSKSREVYNLANTNVHHDVCSYDTAVKPMEIRNYCIYDWYRTPTDKYDYITTQVPANVKLDDFDEAYLTELSTFFPMLGPPHTLSTLKHYPLVFEYDRYRVEEVVMISALLRLTWELGSFGRTFCRMREEGMPFALAVYIASRWRVDYDDDNAIRPVAHAHDVGCAHPDATKNLREWHQRAKMFPLISDSKEVRAPDYGKRMLYGDVPEWYPCPAMPSWSGGFFMVHEFLNKVKENQNDIGRVE